MYVASGIGKMVVSPTDFQNRQTWTVYATYSSLDKKTVSGAVFVFSEDGKLSGFATKIQFMRIQAAKLERVLESANPKESVTPATRVVPVTNSAVQSTLVLHRGTVFEASTSLSPAEATVTSKASEDSKDSRARISELKALISVYTGVPVDEMREDQSFGEMGLDSLAAMELADEMEAKLGIQVQTDDLLLGTVGSLMKLLHSAPSRGVPEISTSPGSTVSDDDTCSESSDSIRDSTGIHTSFPATPAEEYLQSKHGDPIDRNVPWMRPKSSHSTRFKIDTIVYKEVDGVHIPADVYVPIDPPSRPMPVGTNHFTFIKHT
jgi:acyl carrier protein